jgi:hypothetical protein
MQQNLLSIFQRNLFIILFNSVPEEVPQRNNLSNGSFVNSDREEGILILSN